MRNVGRDLLVAAIALAALVAAPTAAADYADEQALAERHAPIVRHRRADRGVRSRRAVHPDRHRPAPRRADRRAPRPVEPHRPREDRPVGRRISSIASSTTSTSRATRSTRAATTTRWAKRLTAGSEPVVYAHVVTRARATREGRAPVLVLLPLQRLQQHARGRLGDDPARLRRDRRRRRRSAAIRSRSATARTRAPTRSNVGGRQARGRRRDATRRLPGRRLAREQVLGCALARELRRGRCRLRRHARPAPRALAARGDDPERRAAAEAAYPWIAFEGRWGELQKAFFNGPTGPNLKTQWTKPITWSEGWSDRSYAVPTGGAFGTSTTDFFCSAVAHGLEGARRSSCGTRCRPHLPRDDPRTRDLRRRPGDLDAGRTDSDRPAPIVGPDHLRLGAHVRQAPATLPRPRRAPRSRSRSSITFVQWLLLAGRRPHRHRHR